MRGSLAPKELREFKNHGAINVSPRWGEGNSLEMVVATGSLQSSRKRCVKWPLPENVAHLVDQTLIFQILVFDNGELLEKFSLFPRQ